MNAFSAVVTDVSAQVYRINCTVDVEAYRKCKELGQYTFEEKLKDSYPRMNS